MPASIANSPELTAEQVVALLVEPLAKASVVLAAGPRIFDSHGDPLRIPKIASWSAAPAWHAENEQITENDPDFSELVLLPSTLKSVKVLHRFSNELARHSVIGIANALRDALVRRVAGVLDDAFLVGTGAANTVTGMANQAGINTLAYGTLDLDDLHDAIAMMLADEVPMASVRWFVPSATFTALRKLKDTSGKYLVQPDVTEAAAFRLLGFPVVVTNRLAAGTILLVDMSEVAVGRDLAPSVKLLDQTYGNFDQMALRVTARYDIGLLHADGVVKMTAA